MKGIISTGLILSLGCLSIPPIPQASAVPVIATNQKYYSKAIADDFLSKGNQYVLSRQFILARTYIRKAAEIYEKISDQKGIEATRVHLFHLNMRLQQNEGRTEVPKLDDFILLMGAAMNIGETSPISSGPFDGYAQTTAIMEASAQFMQGETESAIFLLKNLFSELEDSNKEAKASVLYHMAICYLSVDRDGERAIPVLKEALPLVQDKELIDIKGELLSFLGESYYRNSEYKLAKRIFEKRLQLLYETKNENGYEEMNNNFRIAGTLIQLAKVSVATEDHSQSIKYGQQALQVIERVSNNGSPPSSWKLYEGLALSALGESFAELKDYSQAIQALERAMVSFEDMSHGGVLGEHSPALILGYNYHDKLGLLKFTVDTVAKLLEEILISQGKFKRALEVSEQSRSHLTIQLLQGKRKNLKNSITVSSLSDASRYATQFLLKNGYSSSEAQQFIQEIIKQNREMTKTPDSFLALNLLETAEMSLSRKKSPLKEKNNDYLSFDEIKRIAKKQDATIVYYSNIKDSGIASQSKDNNTKIAIWVISPDGKVVFKESTNSGKSLTSVESVVKASLNSMGVRGVRNLAALPADSSLQSIDKDLDYLYNILIKPIENYLPSESGKDVVFVPQGAIFSVPFPALKKAGDQPLLEKYSISTASSAYILDFANQQSKKKFSISWMENGNDALIVGNPEMPLLKGKSEGAGVQLMSLPGAEIEAYNIAQILGSQVLTGQKATKSKVLNDIEQSSLIHFATHGLLQDFDDLGVPGAVALAPDFSGQPNDGFLTSSEILDLNLSANLAVISACDTGLGAISTEGIVGLQRSFIGAGVPSLVVSLWSVPDAPTAELMSEFYTQMMDGKNKAEALRQAMLATRKNYPNPRDWAAFTLVGLAD